MKLNYSCKLDFPAATIVSFLFLQESKCEFITSLRYVELGAFFNSFALGFSSMYKKTARPLKIKMGLYIMIYQSIYYTDCKINVFGHVIHTFIWYTVYDCRIVFRCDLCLKRKYKCNLLKNTLTRNAILVKTIACSRPVSVRRGQITRFSNLKETNYLFLEFCQSTNIRRNYSAG